MRLNTAAPSLRTHEGAKAKHISVEQQLRRSVMCCMLWENQFYESGEDIAVRIESLIAKVEPKKVAAIAIEARTKMKLRHVPLLLATSMLRYPAHKPLVANLLAEIIQRPDELTEALAIFWKHGKKPKMAHQLRKGIAKAFRKFNEYSLQKYNRDDAIKLRDALFLSHAKPESPEQDALWKRLIHGELATPDTWEVGISAAKAEDKASEWRRLLAEDKLGALALLRNLRNMTDAGIPLKDLGKAIDQMKTERVLPFRFISAAKYAPQLEPQLESAMFRCLKEVEKLSGTTCLLVDVSGSMQSTVSGKSEISRLDAGCGLAMLLREICEACVIVTFSSGTVMVPPRRGFALADAIKRSQPNSSTELGAAMKVVNIIKDVDRLIVITDEQSHDRVTDPVAKLPYIINVASAQNGVGYGTWTHIDGWSEAIVDYIKAFEAKEA